MSLKWDRRTSRGWYHVLPRLAFIGAALLLASDIGVLSGVVDRVSALPAIAALPVALSEFIDRQRLQTITDHCWHGLKPRSPRADNGGTIDPKSRRHVLRASTQRPPR